MLQIKFLRSEGLRGPAAEHIRPVTVKITQRFLFLNYLSFEPLMNCSTFSRIYTLNILT